MLSIYLLAVMVLSFILQQIIPGYTESLYFDPSTALSEPWTFVTSIFLHGGLMHLFFNGYALFLFGSILERKVSKRDFLIIFFVGGIIGSIVYYLTIVAGIAPNVPALGASGAIFAILGAVAVLLPNLRIFFFFFPMRMREAAILWFIIEFLGTFNTSSGIASAAHLGGLAFGVLYAYYLLRKQKEVLHPPWAY